MAWTTAVSGLDSRDDSGLQSAFYTMGIEVLPPEAQKLENEVFSRLNLMSRLRMRGVIPPLPHISSRRGE
jgi:hypothetical protein